MRSGTSTCTRSGLTQKHSHSLHGRLSFFDVDGQGLPEGKCMQQKQAPFGSVFFDLPFRESRLQVPVGSWVPTLLALGS